MNNSSEGEEPPLGLIQTGKKDSSGKNLDKGVKTTGSNLCDTYFTNFDQECMKKFRNTKTSIYSAPNPTNLNSGIKFTDNILADLSSLHSQNNKQSANTLSTRSNQICSPIKVFTPGKSLLHKNHKYLSMETSPIAELRDVNDPNLAHPDVYYNTHPCGFFDRRGATD